MKKLLAISAVVFLSGCATGQYQAYADAHKAQAAAQTARYQALADIAKMGDTTAKVAAVMSLQMGGGQSQAQIAAPVSAGDRLLQWTATLLPALTNVYGINKQTSLGIAQSNNATALGISTNRAFVGIAGKIQAPVGVTNITSSADVSTTNQISGTGVIGAGTYEIGPNSGSNSGNSGRIAGESIFDSTATPTIVTQPAAIVVRPEVVTQPDPIVVSPEVVVVPADTVIE